MNQIESEGGPNRNKLYQDHVDRVTQAVESRRILFRGETPYTEETMEEAVAIINYPKEIFFLYHARDEREPHNFIKHDSLYQAGIVNQWRIQEMNLIHKERDDELI